MTVAGSTLGQRYLLHDVDGREGAAERWIGTDGRLNRPVIVWLLERDETDVERENLFDVARGIAREPQPSFLQVLDIVPDRHRLAIVLEMPEPSEEDDATIRLAALGAARLVLELAESLEAAEATGLQLGRLSMQYLHRGAAGAVQADPIGLFAPSRRSEPPSAAPLVDLLAAVLEPHASVSDAPQERAADEALRDLIERWQRRDATLAVLVDELRAIPGIAARPTAASSRTAPVPVEAIEATRPLTPWPSTEVPGTPARRARTAPHRGRVRWSVAVPAAAAALAILLGLVGLVVATQIGFGPASLNPSGGDSAGPPIEQPAANEVTVGLRAQEPTNVRVTVDGVVQFDGVLNSGERQLWEGNERIQVWTDKGQTLLLSVNGHDLGPYSPAMGARENSAEIAAWNRIDFGFVPGWAP